MISTGWKDVVKRGYINSYVTFRCTTNDRHASVSLQYYEYNTRKWRNVRTPSKKYPADSFIQIGQMFVFIKIQGLHQGGLFRCVAEAHGNKICLRLGILSIVREYIYNFKSAKSKWGLWYDIHKFGVSLWAIMTREKCVYRPVGIGGGLIMGPIIC